MDPRFALKVIFLPLEGHPVWKTAILRAPNPYVAKNGPSMSCQIPAELMAQALQVLILRGQSGLWAEGPALQLRVEPKPCLVDIHSWWFRFIIQKTIGRIWPPHAQQRIPNEKNMFQTQPQTFGWRGSPRTKAERRAQSLKEGRRYPLSDQA